MKITHKHKILGIPFEKELQNSKEVCFWFSKIDKEVRFSYVNNPKNAKKFHLYLISDAMPNIGEWVINISRDNIFKVAKEHLQFWEDDTHKIVKKIIASTNKELGLPDFTPDFKQVFCNNSWITEVEVEYENHMISWETVYDEEFGECQDPVYQEIIKIDSNNFVFVDKITETQEEKKFWNKDEVTELMRSAWNAKDTEYQKNSDRSYHPHFFEWVKNNPLH